MDTDILATFSDFFNCSMEQEANCGYCKNSREIVYFDVIDQKYYTDPCPVCDTLKLPITKNQLKIGSVLHYYGKDATNTRWQVVGISYSLKGKRYSHNNIHTFKDIVILMRFPMHNNSIKRISFRHISKSPLWRL